MIDRAASEGARCSGTAATAEGTSRGSLWKRRGWARYRYPTWYFTCSPIGVLEPLLIGSLPIVLGRHGCWRASLPISSCAELPPGSNEDDRTGTVAAFPRRGRVPLNQW